jgi:predicted transcriptional regulator
MKITAKHQELLRAIKKNPNATLRELMEKADMNSTSTVDYYIKNLMVEGLLRRGNKWEIVQPD